MVISLSSLKQMIEKRLDDLSRAASSNFDSLYEGARYSLLSEGKRIRPLLTLASAEMLQEKGAQMALDVACAIEMIHTYSLIHDDLPCMDDDDFRRGRPTLHRVYNEGHAVLVGDYLLTFAFEVIAKSILSSEKKVAVILSLSKAAGSLGMIGGQIMDISLKDPSVSYVEEMVFRKTAALFGTSLECAALIVDAPKEVKENFTQFGLHFGKIFQLIDDLADQDHPLGQTQAFSALHTLESQIKKLLLKLPGDASLLNELLESLLDKSKVHSSL